MQAPTVHSTSSCAPSTSIQHAYFTLTPKQLVGLDFDIIIVGSGIGGGVLAADLHERLSRVAPISSISKDPAGSGTQSPKRASPDRIVTASASPSPPRILLIERGGAPLVTHCSNLPGLGSAGPDGSFRAFRSTWNVDGDGSLRASGPVFALGGRSTVWDRRAERLSGAALAKFPSAVAQDLRARYYRRAEQFLRVAPAASAAPDVTSELNGSCAATTHWEPVRLAGGAHAFSTADALLSAASSQQDYFKVLLNAKVERLEPGKFIGVVVRGADGECTIRGKKVVLCAGSVETAAILLRSPALGATCGRDFGRVTPQPTYAVSMPFVPPDSVSEARMCEVKLKTRFSLDNGALADAMLSLSPSATPNGFPIMRMTFTLPCDLVKNNSIVLDAERNSLLRVDNGAHALSESRKRAMTEFAVEAMNTLGAAYSLVFLKQATSATMVPLTKLSASDVALTDVVANSRGAEVGTVPMPELLDVDLRLKASSGGEALYVCDMSVLPFAPSTPPALTLAALALRLSDHLLPPAILAWQIQPIAVWNFTKDAVWVTMSLSNPSEPSFSPSSGGGAVKIKSGAKEVWGRVYGKKETLVVKASLNAPGSTLMDAGAGRNVCITRSPPP